MIWWWDRKTSPLGVYERTEIKQIVVNGEPKDVKFLVYAALRDGSRNTDVVSFVIDRFSMIQSGQVEVDLLDFVKTALSLSRRNDELYLQGVEFGIEFTNQDQKFNLELNKFKIDQMLVR
ncbi:hypothetical protein A3J44_05505 [candidate division WOR-1 bacterium RIFCSPHIGHO2_02_FULL_45_12]|nr:MAG: hypothetical protein A3J44_05505 [candidate division WOR-1 bacterium RIFCSPHIGHO2_02_FULL_45_12]